MPGTYQYDVEIKSNVAKLLSDMKQVQDRLDTVEGKEYKIKLNVDEKKLSSVISNLEKMLDSLGKGTGDFKQFENLSKELSSVVSEVQSLSKAFGKVDDSGAKTLLSSIQNIDKSLSELSQNILNVNKNMSNMGGNTSSAVKQVENISNAYQDATKEAEKLADAQSKIGQKTNISSASTESVANSIKEENDVLEQNTQKIKENTQAKEQNANVNLNKYDTRLDSYNGKLDKYQTTINRFNDGGWTSSTYLENVQAVKNAVKEYETLLNELKGKDASLVTSDDINKLDNYEKKIKDTIATVTNMSASEKGYSKLAGQKEIDKINQILRENSAMSSEAKAKIKAYKQELISGNPSVGLEKIHGEIMKIVNAEELAGRTGRSMFDVIKEKAFYGFAAQIGMYFGFNDIVNGFKQVASTVIDLNTQITDLAKVSEATSSQIYDDFSSYADIAKDIGGTISDTISATADWSRNGYNLPDSKELARVALLYKNVGDGIDIDTANESLISTLRGFKMEADEAEKIIDIFNNVSNNEPIDSGGIGEALQRSAASFNAANTSLQESVALISTTNSVIQNPEKVGNMWKVVSMRIRSATSELEQAGEDTDGLVTSTADLQKMIKAMTGYDILESDGKTFKSIYDIVLNISKVWNNLSDLDQSSLLQALAGKQQSNALAAALSNPELLEKSYQEAMDSAGSAAEEEKKYQQSVQYSIDQTKAKLEELSADLLSSDFLKGAIDAGGKLIEVLDGIVKSGNAIPTLLTAIGAALSFKNVGRDKMYSLSF